jgi:hypothetical protein
VLNVLFTIQSEVCEPDNIMCNLLLETSGFRIISSIIYVKNVDKNATHC